MIVAVLWVGLAHADALAPGELACSVERCASGEPGALVVADRGGPEPVTADLIQLGFHKVCGGGSVTSVTEVWCGGKGALPRCERPDCPGGANGVACSDLAKCGIPDRFTATCRRVPAGMAVPETLYCEGASRTVPAEVVPSPARCDTAGPIASLIGAVLLLGAMRRR